MLRRNIRIYVMFVAVCNCVFAAASTHAQNDPLPSWNDGPAKEAVMEFVARVTTQGGPDFVPVPERIAVFDNDGTLWCEKPLPVLHDNAAREYAYGLANGLPDVKLGAFTQALYEQSKKEGWAMVSVKEDWKCIFPIEK